LFFIILPNAEMILVSLRLFCESSRVETWFCL